MAKVYFYVTSMSCHYLLIVKLVCMLMTLFHNITVIRSSLSDCTTLQEDLNNSLMHRTAQSDMNFNPEKNVFLVNETLSFITIL